MAALDPYVFSGAKVVTITNRLAANEKVFFEDDLVDGKIDKVDAGTLQHQTILTLTEAEGDHPIGTKYFIKDNTRWLQLYRVNQWLKVPAAQAVVLGIETSEEAVYYASLAGDDFTVELDDSE